MRPGDIVMIYTDPITCLYPEGKAKLIHLKYNYENIQEWLIEFLDQPGKIYQRLIKKT